MYDPDRPAPTGLDQGNYLFEGERLAGPPAPPAWGIDEHRDVPLDVVVRLGEADDPPQCAQPPLDRRRRQLPGHGADPSLDVVGPQPLQLRGTEAGDDPLLSVEAQLISC
jgi:hypothetical protein